MSNPFNSRLRTFLFPGAVAKEAEEKAARFKKYQDEEEEKKKNYDRSVQQYRLGIEHYKFDKMTAAHRAQEQRAQEQRAQGGTRRRKPKSQKRRKPKSRRKKH